MPDRDLPPLPYLRQRLRYEPSTGRFVWLPNDAMSPKWNGKWAGRVAGARNPNGYLRISIDGVLYRAHRLAWAFQHGEWPVGDVDHINHVRDDNRIENLRLVSRQENCCNSSRSRRNTSGVTGVTWHGGAGKWRAQIHPNRTAIHLGLFDNFDDAVAARKAAEARYGFHRNHGVEAPATRT